MASVQLPKTTEKGLNQGYYGCSSFGQKVSDMANWACKATKRENKYQGPQNGYAVAYSESECYSQIQHPIHGTKESQTAYAMAEFRDEYGRSYGSHKSQNGNAMSKTKVHGPGIGFGNHFSDGNQTSPGKGQNHGYGYGYGSAHGNQKNSGMGHGFSNHTSYEATEAYGYGSTHGNHKNSGKGHGFSNHANYETTEAYGYYDESNGYGNCANNGLAHSPAHHRGKHSGQRQEFIKAQAYGPSKNMDYGTTETETRHYAKTETHYANESHYYGGGRGFAAGNGSHCIGRAGCAPTCNGWECHAKPKNMGDHPVRGLLSKIKDGISGNRSDHGSGSGSGSDSDSDCDEYGKRKVWVSKAI
ncbi:hypothetical protein QQP08_011801 [Theobroma cacao]|nr:hypothetical protein QQP08_011801 [Theobroma cacao]